MTSNVVNLRRLWRNHAIWSAAVFVLTLIAHTRTVSPELVTLAILLIAGQAALGIPVLLQRAEIWAIRFVIFFDSVILLGELWRSPAGIAPLYVGLALVPAVLVARQRESIVPALLYWGGLALVDLTLQYAGGTLSLLPPDPVVLMWVGLASVLLLIAGGQGSVEEEPEQVPTPAHGADVYRLTTLNDHLWETTSSEQALDAALETIGDVLFDTAESRVMSIAMTFSKVDLDEFVVSAVREADRSWVGRHVPIRGVVREAVMGGEPALTQADDALLDQFPALRDRWLLLLPLYTRLDMYGVLLFALRREPSMDDERLRLLETVARMTSQMLRVQHLQNELERSRREVLLDEEDTRHQLARDLHDGPVQKVAALLMQLDFIKNMLKQEPENVPAELDAAQEMVQEATHDLRTFMFGLRPVVLETEGLVPALEQYTQRLRTQDSLNVTLDAKPVPRLESTVEQNVFAIVREAVGNAKKYADGAPITIAIEVSSMGLRTVVRDEGPGFNLEEVERGYGRRASLGLLNMKERAEMIDGFLDIRTSPGEGTTVELLIPNLDHEL